MSHVIHRLEVLDGLGKQVDQDMKNKPVSGTPPWFLCASLIKYNAEINYLLLVIVFISNRNPKTTGYMGHDTAIPR